MHPLIAKNKKKFTLISSLWIGLLFGLALLPGSFCLKILREEDLFSAAHFGAYLILGFMVALTLQFHRSILGIRMNSWHLVWMTLLVNGLVGAGTELIQIFSADRVPSLGDFYCDVAGALTGTIGFLVFKQFLKDISTASFSAFFLKTREKAG